MSFDGILNPPPVSKKPRLYSATGKKSDLLDTVLYKEIKGDNSKPHSNVQFKGIIIMSRTLTLDQFSKKYDQIFVDYVTGTSSDKKEKQTKALEIIESTVYIQELCACLPQPETTKFLEYLKELRSLPKSGEEQTKLRREDKEGLFTTKDLDLIERYPKAYIVKREMGNIREQSVVKVVFPHNFDYSYGVIVGNAPD